MRKYLFIASVVIAVIAATAAYFLWPVSLDAVHPRVGTDLTDILYHRHRETIALPPPDPDVVGQG